MPLKQSEASKLSAWGPVVFTFLHKWHIIKANKIRRLTSPAMLQSGERRKNIKKQKRHKRLSVTI